MYLYQWVIDYGSFGNSAVNLSRTMMNDDRLLEDRTHRFPLDVCSGSWSNLMNQVDWARRLANFFFPFVFFFPLVFFFFFFRFDFCIFSISQNSFRLHGCSLQSNTAQIRTAYKWLSNLIFY